MDLDFDPLFQCWGEFYLQTKMYTFQLNTSRIHPKSKKRGRKSIKSCYISLRHKYMSLVLPSQLYFRRNSKDRVLLVSYDDDMLKICYFFLKSFFFKVTQDILFIHDSSALQFSLPIRCDES